MGSATVSCSVRFGTFEVDLRAGEIRKAGLRVRLQEQPFQVLAMLLEHPDELVTREELQRKLWANDTFVDFDHGVNTAITKIRQALGDSAENPRFVETVARRGYRFIAPVEVGSDMARPREGRALPYKSVALAAGAVAVMVAALVTLDVAGLRTRLFRAPPPVPKIESIAVLPLENISGDPAQEYFADGMTEELITDLGKISALRVISRTSVMGYKGTKKPLPEIARELNVDAIVEGTVRSSGHRVRITAKLLYAPSDRHLWADAYESDVQDVLTLQSEVARAITDQIRIKVEPQEWARLASVGQVNAEAQDAYLHGRYHLSKRTRRDLSRAAGCFQEAILRQPGYALAYASLAEAYLVYSFYALLPPKESFQEARAAAEKALKIDPELGEARTALAGVKFYHDWDWAAAETEFRRALELSRSYAPAHQLLGEYLAVMGRHEEAIAEIKRAEECDPLSPILPTAEGWAFFVARDYDHAIAPLRKALDMDANFPRAYGDLGGVYVQKEMWQEATTQLQKATTLEPDAPDYLAWLGYAYAAAGKTKEATAVLERLKSMASRRYVSPFQMAALCTGLHRKDDALLWLEKGYDERDVYMPRLKVEPALDPLRSDPRFQDLLRRMNFPE